MNVDPVFQRLLSDFHPAVLHSAEETIYAMRPDLTLAYVNLGWTQFAARNGGEPLISLNWSIGSCVQDAIAPVLRPFFTDNYARCLRERRPWEHRYECSSAEVYREFVMMTYPLGEGEGLLVINSLVQQETSHTRSAHAPLDVLYRQETGLVIQCCHCRRVQRCGAERAWDWVPEWVSSPPQKTSHGICEPCFGFYFPKQRRSTKGFPEKFQTME
jgi:hypothetical protein